MKTKINILLSTIFTVAVMLVLSPALSFAQNDAPQEGLNNIVGAFPAGATTDKSVESIAVTIIDWALYLSAIVAVIFIIYGGFLYITSAGDATQAGKGKSALVNAIIGLILVVLSYMIVQVVYKFLVT